MEKVYKYILQYQNGDIIVTHEFSAFIESGELKNRLRDFLCACGWTEKVIKEDILRSDEDVDIE